MKIAFIVSAFPVLSETFILNQITGLIDLGHEVDIFASSKPNEKKIHSDVKKYNLINKTHYFHIPKTRKKRIMYAFKIFLKNFYKKPLVLLKALNFFKYGSFYNVLNNLFYLAPFLNKDYDIIHCHFGPNGIIGVHLKEIGIPGKYLTSFHGYDVNSYPKIMGKNVYNVLFKNGDLFTANTNFTRQQVVKLGCDEEKIIILPVGLRVEKFKFSTRKIQPREPIKILTVGRLVEKKGHEYAIKAIAKIVKKHKNIKYIVAGDGPLRTNLENLALKLGIMNHVEFLGAVEQNKVLNLYQQAHIFILPSVTASNGDREGQALVLQEAQATGLPVVSTLHNGIPEGVLDGKSGFLVPERDVDALAEKLEYLIEHPEIWPKMGRYGRKFVEEHYDIKKLNKRLIEIYQNLLVDNKN